MLSCACGAPSRILANHDVAASRRLARRSVGPLLILYAAGRTDPVDADVADIADFAATSRVRNCPTHLGPGEAIPRRRYPFTNSPSPRYRSSCQPNERISS